MLDERVLAERLIRYDTSRPEELVAAAGFVRGWLESRDIEVRNLEHRRPAGAGRRGRVERGRRAVRGPARASRRGARACRAVRAAARGRSPDRPRRLRHEGRARGDDVRAQGPRAAGPVRVRLAVRTRRGVRGARRALDRRDRPRRVRRRLRDHRRTDQPAHRRRGEGRARDADRGPRPRRAQLDALARRQRGAEGDRRVPRDRVAAVLTRVLGDVRPSVDQPRADPGRRRAQQGPRRVPDGRRHPLPARPGPRGDPGADPRDP